MKKAVLVLTVVLGAVSLGIAQPVVREFKTLVWNNSHVVSYEKRGSNLAITMEMIADFDDDRTNQKWTERDFTSVRIDMNNNGSLDKDLDIAFGVTTGTGRLCPQYLREEWASSVCGGLASRGSLKMSFSRSPFHDTAHPIFEYSVPISELRTHSETVGFIFKFHSGRRGFVFYPAGASLKNTFTEKITLNLANL